MDDPLNGCPKGNKLSTAELFRRLKSRHGIETRDKPKSSSVNLKSDSSSCDGPESRSLKRNDIDRSGSERSLRNPKSVSPYKNSDEQTYSRKRFSNEESNSRKHNEDISVHSYVNMGRRVHSDNSSRLSSKNSSFGDNRTERESHFRKNDDVLADGDTTRKNSYLKSDHYENPHKSGPDHTDGHFKRNDKNLSLSRSNQNTSVKSVRAEVSDQSYGYPQKQSENDGNFKSNDENLRIKSGPSFRDSHFRKNVDSRSVKSVRTEGSGYRRDQTENDDHFKTNNDSKYGDRFKSGSSFGDIRFRRNDGDSRTIKSFRTGKSSGYQDQTEDGDHFSSNENDSRSSFGASRFRKNDDLAGGDSSSGLNPMKSFRTEVSGKTSGYHQDHKENDGNFKSKEKEIFSFGSSCYKKNDSDTSPKNSLFKSSNEANTSKNSNDYRDSRFRRNDESSSASMTSPKSTGNSDSRHRQTKDNDGDRIESDFNSNSQDSVLQKPFRQHDKGFRRNDSISAEPDTGLEKQQIFHSLKSARYRSIHQPIYQSKNSRTPEKSEENQDSHPIHHPESTLSHHSSQKPPSSYKHDNHIKENKNNPSKFSSSFSSNFQNVDRPNQAWVKAKDNMEIKISSQTESLLQVLPSKVKGLDFIGPKYPQKQIPECDVNIQESNETNQPENDASDNEMEPNLELLERSQVLCESTNKNQFRISFGKISINVSIGDSKLEALITKLESSKNLSKFHPTQIWPMRKVLEGENVIFVKTPSLKSSSTYLLPMIAKTVENAELYGPRNIILVPNIQMVAQIEKALKLMSEKKFSIVSYYGDDVDLSLEEKFASSDFIISTPCNFSKLLTTIDPTRLSKLNRVAFDSAHKMDDASLEELPKIIQNLSSLTESSDKSVQYVLTSEFWNKKLEKMTREAIISPILFLACPLQAAISSNIKLSLEVIETDIEKLKLTSAILKKDKFYKRIVFCKNIKEMGKIETHLRKSAINNILTVGEDSNNEVVCEFPEDDEPVTILCPAAMTSHLKIDDADCLIIFSIFPALKDSFSVFQSHFSKETSQRCQSYIFIDRNSDFMLTNMISNLDVEKPQKLDEILQSAKEAYEKSKLDVPFCDKIIQFGKCSAELMCPKRHILDASRDSNKTSLSKRRVLLDIVKVYDATHYYGKICCHLNEDQISESDFKVFSDYQETFRSICDILRFSFHSRSKLNGRPKIGDHVLVQDEGAEMMIRGEIVDIVRRDKNLVPIAASVFIESGYIVHRNVDEIYEMPPKLKNLPAESVNIILGDVVPSDSSGDWSPKVTSIARDALIDKNPSSAQTWLIGNIQFVIGNTIVLDNITCYQRTGSDFAPKFQMKQQLLMSKFAQESNIVKSLINDCIQAGLKIGLESLPIALLSSSEVEVEKSTEKELEAPSESLSAYLDEPKKESKVGNDLTLDAVHPSNLEEENDCDVQSPKEVVQPTNKEENDHSSISHDSDESSPEDDEEEKEHRMDPDMELFMKMLGEALHEVNEEEGLNWNQIFSRKSEPLEKECSELQDFQNETEEREIEEQNKTDESEFQNENDDRNGKIEETSKINESEVDVQEFSSDWSNDGNEVQMKEQNKTDESEFQPKNDDLNGKIEETSNTDESEVDDQELSSNWSNDRSEVQNKTDESEFLIENAQKFENDDSDDKIEETSKTDESEVDDQECSSNLTKDGNEFQVENDESLDKTSENGDQDVKFLIADKSIERNSESEVSVKECQNECQDEIPDDKFVTEVQADQVNMGAHKNEEIPDEVPYFSPKVYWRQKDDIIWARIMILDVQDYKIKYAKNFFTFRADVNDKVYLVTVLTFAPIVPESLTCNVTGQCVEVRFEAAFKGFEWPRLTYFNDGGSRIKRDPDYLAEDDIKSLPICEQIALLGDKKRKIKEDLGLVKKSVEENIGYVPGLPGAPPSCDLDSESDYSDSNSVTDNLNSANLYEFL